MYRHSDGIFLNIKTASYYQYGIPNYKKDSHETVLFILFF